MSDNVKPPLRILLVDDNEDGVETLAFLIRQAGCEVVVAYGIDPVLAVHGHSMRSRALRSGTTDSSIWFHRPVRADRWNLLEARSPAAARHR